MIAETAILLGFAVATWAFCGALMGVGRRALGLDAALLLHAAGAPVGAAAFSAVYFHAFGFTGPWTTAAAFVAVALALDALVVAPLIERSYAMFASVLGVWIPMALIFAAVVATGALMGPP